MNTPPYNPCDFWISIVALAVFERHVSYSHRRIPFLYSIHASSPVHLSASFSMSRYKLAGAHLGNKSGARWKRSPRSSSAFRGVFLARGQWAAARCRVPRANNVPEALQRYGVLHQEEVARVNVAMSSTPGRGRHDGEIRAIRRHGRDISLVIFAKNTKGMYPNRTERPGGTQLPSASRSARPSHFCDLFRCSLPTVGDSNRQNETVCK